MTGVVKYDVGYVNEITLSPSTDSISAFTLVVNKGAAPLKLATASVVTFSDDNPSFTWAFVKVGNSTAVLNSDRSAGLLSPLATTQIVTNGLVPERIDDQLLNFEMNISPAPTAGLNLHTQAVVRIDTPISSCCSRSTSSRGRRPRSIVPSGSARSRSARTGAAHSMSSVSLVWSWLVSEDW